MLLFFFAEGVFIDASEEVGDDNNYTMTLSKVKMWEEANGPIPENSVVMVRLGWAKHYTDKDKYLGYKDNGFSHPGIAVDVAHYLVNSKKVRLPLNYKNVGDVHL